MVRSRTLLVLLAITAAVVVGALVTSSMRGYETPELAEDPLLPSLGERINDVAEIEIRTADGRRVLLTQTPEGWVDASRGGYPAKFEPIKKLLIEYAEVGIAERKTSDPEDYQKLGLLDVDEEGARSTLVEFREKGGQTIASVLIGNRMPGGEARFVRRNDEAQVLLTSADLTASPMPLTWLEREVIRVPRDSVRRVSIAHPSGETFTVFRTDDGSLDMAGVPEGYRVRGQAPLSSIAGALAYVDFLNVRPVGDIDFSSLRPPMLATYETKDGMVVDVSVWAIEATKWTTFSVSKMEDQSRADGSSETGEGDDARNEAIDAEIQRLQDKLSGWAYEISPSSLLPLETSMIELIQEIPAQEPEAGPPSPPAPPDSHAPASPDGDAGGG